MMSYGGNIEHDIEKIQAIRTSKRVVITWLCRLLLADKILEAEKIWKIARDGLIDSKNDVKG